MIGRRKKPEPISRSPHIVRPKQSTFQYSSNRSPSERLQRDQAAVEQSLNPTERLKSLQFQLRLRHIAFTLAFVLIVVVLSVLTASPHVVIAKGQQPLRNSSIYDSAAAEIAGSGLLSRSKLTLDREKIAQEMQTRFPELSDITVTTGLFSRRAQVNASTTRPVVVLAANAGSYVLDTRGVALFDTRQDTPATGVDKLLLVNDQSDIPITVGKPALTPDQIRFAIELRRQAEAKGLTLDTTSLVAGGGELDVKHSGDTYFVKYNLYEDARKSFGTFYATREYIDRTKIRPVEYIDVRVPERAYVK